MDINRVILIGRLVRDPESRILPSGVTVTTFRIAVNRRPSKEGNQNADFFDVVAWRQLADLCSKYLKKGQRVAVEGSLRQRSWQDQNGNYQSKVEILAENVQFLEPKASDSSALRPEEETSASGASSAEDFPFSGPSGFEETFDVLEEDIEVDSIDDLDEFNFQGGDSD